ncbi:putative thioesterase atnL [Diplogelasinospora grovesii]|uniref:Thioesterase atnL n=1 Tax=Diplogelasinospora grovesii TaxID=303347 RepID=A0AAN6MWP0_9PEZI|nr:putative thioesterase atnL [Diplogelasinospora grovesii]
MVTAIGIAQALSRIPRPILLPAAVFSLAYGGYTMRDKTAEFVSWFLSGPGRNSRIIALLMLIINWKSVPLVWTVRVLSALASHLVLREHHTHSPDKLFHYSICQSHVTLFDIDYNLHKSNSTYFADLDISRAHLAGHLLARGVKALSENAKTKLVSDPRDPTQAAKGGVFVMLGAVHSSFKREIKPYQPYEIWTRVLSWDRKWFYMLSYFVEKGAVKPRSWDAASFGPTRKTESKSEDWEKKVFATAVSKYVFKIGRLSVHPAIVIGASGLLPERPGGWVATDSGMATPAEPMVGNTDAEAKDETQGTEWDWRRTEAERLRGLVYAKHFATPDELASQFDGGEDGALGRWSLG